MGTITQKLEYLVETREILMANAKKIGIDITPQTTLREVATRLADVPQQAASYLLCYLDNNNIVPVSGGRRTLHIITAEGSTWHIEAPSGVTLSAADGEGSADVLVTIPPMWDAPSDVRLTITTTDGQQAEADIVVFSGSVIFYTDGQQRESYRIGNNTYYTEADNAGPYVHNVEADGVAVTFPSRTTAIDNTPYWGNQGLTYLTRFHTNSNLGKNPNSFSLYNRQMLQEVSLGRSSVVGKTSLNIAFCQCTNLRNVHISDLDTSSISDMGSMFHSCSNLTSLDISGWNTSNVTNMGSMFQSCSNLTSLDISGWNTSNVTNMGYMFYTCSYLQNVDLSGWNTSNVTNTSEMFTNCTQLREVKLSGWDMSSVIVTQSMFWGCNALTTIIGPIAGINANLSVNASPITRDSAMVLINGLTDRTGQAARSLTLSASTKKLLSAADIAIASAKNWTIA